MQQKTPETLAKEKNYAETAKLLSQTLTNANNEKVLSDLSQVAKIYPDKKSQKLWYFFTQGIGINIILPYLITDYKHSEGEISLNHEIQNIRDTFSCPPPAIMINVLFLYRTMLQNKRNNQQIPNHQIHFELLRESDNYRRICGLPEMSTCLNLAAKMLRKYNNHALI